MSASLRPERIGTATILADALSLIGARRRVLLACAIPAGAVTAALDVSAHAAGIEFGTPSPDIGEYGYWLGLSALYGTAMAVCTRVLLGRSLRPDRGLLIGLALLVAVSMLVLTPVVFMGSLFVLGSDPGLSPVAILTYPVLVLGGTYVLLRLTLWPAACIDGRVEGAAAESWRLMRRATRGMILANAVVSVPVLIAMVLGGMAVDGSWLEGAPTPASLTVEAVLGTLLIVLSSAITVAIYRRRVGLQAGSSELRV